MRVALLALAVGLVLADSSVVTLGLPDILADFDTSPESVAWVLTGYNLVLALAALPAALLVAAATRGDGLSPGARQATLLTGGLLVFAAASLACAVADSLALLVAARCIQGLGGAAVACAALPALVAETGDRRRGTAIWGAAGAVGAAIGPAAGGFLTEGLSWEAIFAVQVPAALVCLAAVRRGITVEDTLNAGRSRPDWPALASLAFLGAGLTAALFLLVLLLIAGWRHSPIEAALAVSVMPAAALTAGALGRNIDGRARGAGGAILCAGGLAALGLLPDANIAWTVVPQILIGLGLGLALGALTEEALHERRPLALHGGWTLASRHAGVVAALAILTPLFTTELQQQTESAQEVVLARILESPIEPATKLELGLGLAEQLRGVEGQVPEVGPAFDRAFPDPEDAAEYAELQDEVADQLDRAATGAFQTSFIVAALLAALAVVPLVLDRRRRRTGVPA